MQGNRQVAGQSPDGGGPDHEVQLAVIDVTQLAQIVLHCELDINSGTRIILVIDLSFCQSGLILGAPIYGLQTLVDVTLLVHFAEDTDFLSLKAGIHGLIGMLPIAQNANTLKAFTLNVYVTICKLIAGSTELSSAHFLVIQLVLLDDSRLNGHTMVVPTGNIRGIIAIHGIIASDEVLDGLIQCMTHMQIAVGERRAVMQVEQRLAFILLQQLMIEVHCVPILQHAGFPLGQACSHGKLGFRHEECILVILDHLSLSPKIINSRRLDNLCRSADP